MIIRLYATRCENCDQTEQPYETEQDACAHALAKGWSVYPLLCPRCNTRLIRKVISDGQKDRGIVRLPGKGSQRS